MGAIPMPGGWTLSMLWLPMCGHSVWDAAASFLAMWGVMMVAMMTPVVAVELRPSRTGSTTAPAVGDVSSAARPLLAAAAYFCVWAVPGAIIFAVGSALAALALQQPALAHAAPVAGGWVLLAAGAIQWSAWKARRLACCRRPDSCAFRPPGTVTGACRQGVQMGLRCVICCANLTAALLVLGVMDLRVMVAATIAVALERILPSGRQAACITGVILVTAGLYLMAAS
jgi:predicted metal-binding membrane protein